MSLYHPISIHVLTIQWLASIRRNVFKRVRETGASKVLWFQPFLVRAFGSFYSRRWGGSWQVYSRFSSSSRKLLDTGTQNSSGFIIELGNWLPRFGEHDLFFPIVSNFIVYFGCLFLINFRFHIVSFINFVRHQRLMIRNLETGRCRTGGWREPKTGQTYKLVTRSFLLLLVRHLFLEAMHLFLLASCY